MADGARQQTAGVLEVGHNDHGEIVVNHPNILQDENGGHIVFSVEQARAFARLLLKRADQLTGTRPSDENADGLRVVWDWSPWERFLGARYQLIRESVAEGKSFEQIARELSCEPVQCSLIAQADEAMIAGIPGNVWPPKGFGQ